MTCERILDWVNSVLWK